MRELSTRFRAFVCSGATVADALDQAAALLRSGETGSATLFSIALDRNDPEGGQVLLLFEYHEVVAVMAAPSG